VYKYPYYKIMPTVYYYPYYHITANSVQLLILPYHFQQCRTTTYSDIYYIQILLSTFSITVKIINPDFRIKQLS